MAGTMAKYVKRRHIPYTKFKAYMQEQNIRQEQLAKLLDKSITTVNQNLNGTGGDFSMQDVRKICLTYGISSDSFFITQKVS
ncbi:helix-turn-helix domain-containing protein [Clostridium sp. DL1XJH146]